MNDELCVLRMEVVKNEEYNHVNHLNKSNH